MFFHAFQMTATTRASEKIHSGLWSMEILLYVVEIVILLHLSFRNIGEALVQLLSVNAL